MDINIVINQMAVLFLLIAVGFLVGRLKILTQESNRVLTRIVLFIALPCTILNSVIGHELDITIGDYLYYLLMCFLSFALAFAITIPLVFLSRGPKHDRGILTYMSVFSNCGFMGFPVILSIFGAAGGFYAAIFNIPFNLLSFSVGIWMIAGSGSKFNPRLLINPPLVAALLAVPIALTGFTPPDFIADTIRLAGGVTTPGAMIVIGATLSYIPFRNVFAEWRVWLTSALRLIIIPIATFLVFQYFIEDPIMLGVLVVLSAMPTAAQTAMLALEYDGNEKTASAGVFITTLLCGVTIPLLALLLH